MCSAAVAAVTLSAGGAAADDDLISALNNPAVGAACFPSGQVGSGNTFNGTQNINCSQSTSQDITNPPTTTGGGVTGQVVLEEGFTIEPHSFNGEFVACPAGKVVTGGGLELGGEGLVVLQDRPSDEGDGWIVGVGNLTDNPLTASAFAVCVDAAA
ncbi:hypothetical protein AB0892_21865 [Streptomyces sp. NPDC005409]|uniref:hypothetical protein n=1 Tax=Streptomyces sp. NPDC005409 TaxID=3155342 RepID=UPI0034522CA2